MVNYVNISATLFSIPKIEKTQKDNDKVSFLVLIKGLTNSFPIRIVMFNSLAFIITSVIETWKRGDNLRIEGALDFYNDEIVIVANYICNYTRLVGERIEEIKGELISDPVDLDEYLKEKNEQDI